MKKWKEQLWFLDWCVRCISDAARTAFHMMLVEDFGNELSQNFALLSCLQWALNPEENKPWIDHSIKPEEPEEEVCSYCIIDSNYLTQYGRKLLGLLFFGTALVWYLLIVNYFVIFYTNICYLVVFYKLLCNTVFVIFIAVYWIIMTTHSMWSLFSCISVFFVLRENCFIFGQVTGS